MPVVGEQVRKSYEEKRRRRKARGEQRPWKLKRMAMEVEEEPGTTGRGRDARTAPRHEQDLERFMQVRTPSLPPPFCLAAGVVHAALSWDAHVCIPLRFVPRSWVM